MSKRQPAKATRNPELDRLTPKIKAEHQACGRHQRSAVQHALKCGEMLLKARELIKHGNSKKNPAAGWKKYCQGTCGIPYSTAHRYIFILKNKNLWPESPSVGDLGVTGLEYYIREKQDHAKRNSGPINCTTNPSKSQLDKEMQDPDLTKFWEEERRKFATGVIGKGLWCDEEIDERKERVAKVDQLLTTWWTLFYAIQEHYHVDQAGSLAVLKTIQANSEEWLAAPDDDEEPITGSRSPALVAAASAPH